MAGPGGQDRHASDLRTRAWFNENLESRNFFVPGVMVVVVGLSTLLLTSMAVVREKEIGTMEQIMVTPITPAEFILGKTIPFALIGFVDVTLVTLIGVFWFEVPIRGNLLLLFWAPALFLMNTLGLGLLISTVSQTQQQAMMTTFFFFFPGDAALGLRLPHRQHARGRAVADAGQSDALFPGDRPRHLPEGRGGGNALAADAPAVC